MFKRHNEHLWTQPNLHHVEERRSEIELLMPNGSEIIGLFGRDYFSRSTDLSDLDLFLWGVVKKTNIPIEMHLKKLLEHLKL